MIAILLPLLALCATLPPTHTQEPTPPATTAPATPPAPAESPTPPLPLLDHARLTERMQGLAAAHPTTTTLVRLGRSRAGRELLALRLADGETTGKPAIMVVANLEGPQTFSSALALWQAERIAEQFAAGDERARAFLARATLYILPRANPDAAEARFQKPTRELLATGPGLDEDRDGRAGEDPPADIDGDGVIAQLRVADARGEWMEDPTDARALVRADARKGERGRWRVWPEGFDSDGDERVAEDPLEGARVDRNFAHDWQEHSVEGGRFPLDEPEARALADFVILHRELALVLTYGSLDNLVEKPKSVKPDAPPVRRMPAPGVLEPDAQVLEELGRRYAKACSVKPKGYGESAGSFQEWAYQHRGLLSLAICPWDIPLESKAKPAEGEKGRGDKEGDQEQAEKRPGEKGQAEKPAEEPSRDPKGRDEKSEKPRGGDAPKPGDDAKRLAWIDANGEGARFLPWRKLTHPQLGEVEVGGLAPYARIDPPAGEQDALARAQLDFLLGLGEVLPRLEITRFEARALGGGLLELEALVTGDGLLPQRTASGRRTRAVRPARVRLELPAGAQLLAGEPQVLVGDLDGMGGAKAQRELRWLVRGAAPQDLRLELDSDNAGAARRAPEVQ